MKNLVSYLPIIGFLAYLGKILYFSPSFPDSIVLIALISYVILDHIRLTQPIVKKYEDHVKKLEERLDKMDSDLKILQASNNSLKLSVGMRSVNGKNI